MMDYIEKIISCNDIEDAWALHLKEMSKLGFSRIMYGYTCYRSGQHLGDRQDLLILSNHPESYMSEMLKDDLYVNAPMIRWSLNNTGAKSWSHIELAVAEGRLSEGSRKVYDLNVAYGVKAGYSLSFPSTSSRIKGGIGLCAKDSMSQADVDALWQERGRDIWVINNVAHLKIQSLPYLGAQRPLTPRQRAALEWVGEGKTTQDIATIMGLTPTTVEKHLRLAREALDVESTAQAVLKASLKKQIYLLEPSAET